MKDRLARALVRWRWPVLALWAALGVLGVERAAHVQDRLDVQGGSSQATEASRVADILSTRFHQDIGETFLVIVSGPTPFDSGRPRLVLDSLIATLRRAPHMREVVSLSSVGDSVPVLNDPRTTLALATLDIANADSVLTLVTTTRAAIGRVLATFPDRAAYRVNLTGDTPLELDMLTVTTQDVARSERRLLPLAGAILLLAFGSLVAALLPLVIGFLAIAVALAVVAVLATVMPMSIFVLNMTTMIGLGVGIDYSLLVVTRFREELDRGLATPEAVVRTVGTAGATVITSGLCVAVGFAALLFTPLIETRSIGVGGLVVVAVAVVLSLTLLPAVLVVLGSRIGRRSRIAARFPAAAWWDRWARFLSHHPTQVLLAGGLAMAGFTVPLARITIGLPARGWWPTETEAGAGLDLLTRLGGAGYVQPLRVLVEWPAGRTAVDAGALRGLRALSDSLQADPRVRAVRSLVDLRAKTSVFEYVLFYSDLAAIRARHPALLDALLSKDGRIARLDVVLRDTTSQLSAMDVVRHARRLAARPPGLAAGARILVGGYVAENVDLQDDLLNRFPLLVGSIFGATVLMLGLVFRSVLIPLKAILLNTLSVSATFGLVVLVFQRGIGGRLLGLQGPTEAIFVLAPVLVFAVVFGLSMDYEVFLLSRIKEAYDRSGDNDGATIEGLRVTAAVISSAALLMISVFAAFALARVLVIQMLGFGLAVAVLLDATIVRLMLVPALMHLAGRWNWWPGIRGPRSR